jgi:hypothetical protein
MYNIKKIIWKLCIVLVINIIFVGCTKNNIENNSNDNGQIKEINTKSQSEDVILEKYNAQGKIVKVNETGIYVQVDNKVEKYNVLNEMATNHYIGEYVGLNKLDGDGYDIFADESYDYKNRFTPTGYAIKRITGTVGYVKDNVVTAVTEMGDMKLLQEGDFNLENGSQAMFDYVELPEGNLMVNYYDEAAKVYVQVKEISRDPSGMMMIFAVATDSKEYDIRIDENTETNFALSSLNVDDEIIVYPAEMTGEVPITVKGKLIVKN